MIRRISAFCVCLALCLSAAAQVPELEMFQDASEGLSILFRGRQATRYPIPANGHIYWNTPEFSTGDVVYEGRLYKDVILNVNALLQRVLVRPDGNVTTVELPTEDVERFTMGGHDYLRLGDTHPELEEGYYEVIHRGRHTIYRHVVKRMLSTAGNSNGNAIGYDDPNYRSEISRYYGYSAKFYIELPDGSLERIKSRKDLFRHYPDKKKEARRYALDYGIKAYGAAFNNYCQTILSIIDP